VREAAIRLKVGKTAPCEALRAVQSHRNLRIIRRTKLTGSPAGNKIVLAVTHTQFSGTSRQYIAYAVVDHRN
jgi:hypothetical protein